MSFQLIMGTAMSAVGTNKLRTGLTLLGIIIGVSSVIALMSIGLGSQSAITERIQALGTNILFVSPALTADGSNNELTLVATSTVQSSLYLVAIHFAVSVPLPQRFHKS